MFKVELFIFSVLCSSVSWMILRYYSDECLLLFSVLSCRSLSVMFFVLCVNCEVLPVNFPRLVDVYFW
jgi:accessory gene regulator protein AgrB